MIDPVIFAVVSVVLSAGGVVFGVRRLRQIRERLEAAWSAAAERLGGRFEAGNPTFWRANPARVIATLEPGIEVTVDHFTQSTGKSTVTFTRLVAKAPGAGDLQLKLSGEGVLASVGKALGMDDLQLGDPPFDDRFLVRTNDPELARAWLAEPARRALVAVPPAYQLVLKAGEVKTQRVGLEVETEALIAVMRAVAAFAGGGRVLMDAWRALAADLGGTVAGEHFVVGEVRFEGEVEGRQLAFETTAEPAGIRVRRDLGVRDAPHFEVAAGQPLSSIPEAARLFRSPSAEGDWEALQPARFTCDGETAVLSWTGLVPDGKRVRAAASLLGAVESGPYR